MRSPNAFLLIAFLAATPSQLHAGVISADGTICTLTDAILAANSDSTVGGCTGSAGADVIVLDADVVLNVADLVNSTELRGGFPGLPNISTEITIQAGLGDRIERDAALGCDEADPDAFRIFNVIDPGNLHLEGLTISGGCVAPASATAAGGAIAVDEGTLSIDQCRFEGHVARGATSGAFGGALDILDGTVPAIDRSTFEGNTARGGAFGSSGSPADGGAIYLQNSTVGTISETLFLDNLALGGAGAVSGTRSNGGGLRTSFTAVTAIRDTIFRNNTAQGGTGPFNSGQGEGGGAYVSSNTIQTIENCLFEDNQALGGGSDQDDSANALGGGLYITADVTTLTGSTFRANRAVGGDGVDDGSAGRGGGLYLSSGELTTLSNNTFVDNQALGGTSFGINAGGDAQGGALYVSDTIANMRHNTVADNRAIGGGQSTPFAADGSPLFTGEATEAEGGGLWISPSGTVTGADNNLLADNTTTLPGGSPTGNDCHTDGGTVTSNGYNLVEAVGTCTFADLTDQTAVEPALFPAGDHGCSTPLPDGTCAPSVPLDLISPAVDQGSCATSGATTDGRGFSRPVDLPAIVDLDDACDPGAYESRDDDQDNVEDGVDNCPADPNTDQADNDNDGLGNPCDLCLGDNTTGDGDKDGLCANFDCDDEDPTNACAPIFADGFESGNTDAW